MVLASNYDQSQWMKAADLDEELLLKIKDVTEEPVGAGKEKEMKLCVWFTNQKQGLLLNKTNNRTLRGAYGDETDEWVGKRVVVFVVETERGPGLRVRIPTPKGNGGEKVKAAAANTPATRPIRSPKDDDLNDSLEEEDFMK
jgi:hypothetical protein